MWLSRNITQAPLKKIPIHVLIPAWHYGGTKKDFYTQQIWEAVCNTPSSMSAALAKASALCQNYARDQIGVDMGKLLQHGETYPELDIGDLAFAAAYLDAGDVEVTGRDGGGQVSDMRIGPHKGEFRFDGESGEVSEFVVVVTSDTITQPPDTQSIFLGLETKDGRSRRIGLGWVYYSKTEGHTYPAWRYRVFRIS